MRIHSIGTKETVSSGVILDVSTFPSSRATYLRAIVSQCEGILPHPRIPLSFISAKPFAGVISLTVLPKQVVEFLHQGVFMLLDALGDLVFVNLPEAGDEVAAGEPFADVESVKAVSDVYSPLTGVVDAINDNLLDTPEAINEAPYDAWFIKVRDITDKEELMDAEAYEAFLKTIEE